MESIERVLPHSVEAEQAILGCIINYPDKIIDIAYLDTDDFYVSRHKNIFKIITGLIKKKVDVDLITVLEEIKLKQVIEECGGISYVTELVNSVFSSGNIVSYADIVKDKSSRRKLIKTSRVILENAYEGDIKETIDEIEDDLFKISISNNSNSEMTKIDAAVEKSILKLEERYKNGGKLIGIPSGFEDLDRLTNGLNNKDLIIIAGRPSMGKTAFALNIGLAASIKHRVVIFSIEMSEEQLTNRLLAAKSLIQLEKIKKGELTGEEFEKIAIGANDLMRRNLYIDETTSLLGDIKAKCRKLKIQNGLNVIIIDYLQLIRTTLKANSREQEVSHISRELKALAKELDVTVIALSQLSRAPDQRADHRPMLSDLRESGSIEQDADIIHFLYRDQYYNQESEDRNIAEVITAKNRNGQVKTIKLAWLAEYQRFAGLDVIRK